MMGSTAGASAEPPWMKGVATGAGIGGAIGGIGSDIFGHYKNPGEEAMKYLTPFQDHYNRLINDPTYMMNRIGKGFSASPGYQYNVGQATKAANSVAGAGGMLGSPGEQASLAKTTSGLANQDYYNYMNHALQQYGLGLSGGTNIAEDEAGAAYQGANQSNQHDSSMWSGIGTLLGGAAGGAAMM